MTGFQVQHLVLAGILGGTCLHELCAISLFTERSAALCRKVSFFTHRTQAFKTAFHTGADGGNQGGR